MQPTRWHHWAVGSGAATVSAARAGGLGELAAWRILLGRSGGNDGPWAVTHGIGCFCGAQVDNRVRAARCSEATRLFGKWHVGVNMRARLRQCGRVGERVCDGC